MNIDSMLDRDEGVRHVAYRDTLGVLTIGRGHTGPEVHEGLVWDDAQIDFAYQLDKASAWQACADHFSPWFSSLNPARQAVLWSMMFQMGPSRVLGFHDTLAAIRDEHYAHAAECMRQSIWARQTPLRVARLAHQIETGEWQ